MTIDWFTVGAQVLNFLVLVWLLKRFLYGPIINMMDAREQRIAKRLDEAEVREEEAAEETKRLRDAREAFVAIREDRLAELERELGEQRRELLEEARADVAHAKEEWLEALEGDQQGVLREFRERAEERLFNILRQVLVDVADSELDRRTVEVFLERLASLDETQRRAFVPNRVDGAAKVSVRTAFELGGGQRDHIRQVLKQELDEALEVEFDVEEELLAGIELRLDGRKFGWSLRDYLDGLEEELWSEVRSSGTHRGALASVGAALSADETGRANSTPTQVEL
jgi:F-type H+-transporting ATPase subunit b